MTKRRIVIATRESPLALAQAEWVKSRLQSHHPHLAVEFLGITTQADKMLSISLTEIGGKGLFVKELEETLLDGRADAAVHSMKDVPMEPPHGLIIPVICEREDPRDVFVSNRYNTFLELPTAAIVGTSSLRRQVQMRALRSDLVIEDLRGNVNTRLGKLDRGDFLAIILAAAGLKRLHLTLRIRSYLSPEQSLPAAGQGALGIECRADDEGIRELIAPLNHKITHACVSAERALCRELNGGCKVPLAAFAQIHHDVLSLRGLVANRDGIRILRAREQGSVDNAEEIGKKAAKDLISQGALKILAEYR